MAELLLQSILTGFECACNCKRTGACFSPGTRSKTLSFKSSYIPGNCRGLLIRGGDILEEASHIGTVVFDKTGTLTEGRPTLHTVLPSNPDMTAEQLLAYAAALERESSHPLAQAILTAAESSGMLSDLLPQEIFTTGSMLPREVQLSN